MERPVSLMNKVKMPFRVPILLAVVITVVGLSFAAARLRWPDLKIDAVTIGLLVIAALPWLPMILESAELPGGWKLIFREPEPAQGMAGEPLPPIATDAKLPNDYLFVNHTSFYLDDGRHKAEQAAIRKKTHVDRKHYHIHVNVDSYYSGALDRVDHVEYILHQAYSNPERSVSNRHDRFLLKEMANGEFVLLAKAYMKDRSEPILLHRYITLWDTGPKI